MKDKRKKKDRTWADAARLALEKHPNTPMTAKQILEVIQKEGLKETSGTSPLACLNAMLHTNTRVGDGTFYKIPGKSGLYALKKEESPSLVDGASEPVCEYDLEGIEMTETNNSISEENGVSVMKLPEEESSELDSNATATALQSKPVSSTQQYTKKALKQALRQHHKRRNGVSMMVNKAVPRVVLTPLKVSDDQPDSQSEIRPGWTTRRTSNRKQCQTSLRLRCPGWESRHSLQVSETKNGFGEESEKNVKHNQRSPNSKQISQHLKKLKKSGLGHLKWTKAEDIDIETPGSILVNTNLRALINKHTFASLPQHFQQYLLLLLPDVDRQMGTDGVSRLSNSALNNEFFAYAAQGWKQRLAEGEFTPEMQLRIRQEMDKEKKTETWKEKFFETYYGQKLGMTEEESTSLTCMQNYDEGQDSAAPEAPKFSGTTETPEKTELKIAEEDCECEEEEIQITNMELASKVETGLPSDDMLHSEVPDTPEEESVVEEEIAVDSSTCEYLDQELDQQEPETSEYVGTRAHAAEEGGTTVLPSNGLTIPQELPSHSSPLRTSAELSPEMNEQENSKGETMTEFQADPSALDPVPSVPVESENNSVIFPVQTMEQRPFSELKPSQPEQETLTTSQDKLLGAETKTKEGPWSTEESKIKCQSNTGDALVSEKVETETETDLSSEREAPTSKENNLCCTRLETDAVKKTEPVKAQDLDEHAKEITKKSDSFVEQRLPPEAKSIFCEEPEADQLSLTLVPASSLTKELQMEEHEAAPTDQQPTGEEETQNDNAEAEFQILPFTPTTSRASPVANEAADHGAQHDEEVDSCSVVQENSLDELDSEVYGNGEDSYEPVPQAKDPKPVQSLSDPLLTKQVEQEMCSSEVPEIIHSEDDIKDAEKDTNAYIMAEKPPESSVKQPSHHQGTEKIASVTPWGEVSKVKQHKSYLNHHCSTPVESLKPLEPDCKDGENWKRKTGEQHSGICKEKKARMDNGDTGHVVSPASERASLPKEELRVPPLKIQLSKVGLPFIIKTPVSKPESTLSSQTGRNIGARTLADIKARAHQARAQREAAAAAAVAAAAHITSGDSGPPPEGTKTRTLAHIKEQTKAKLYAKHQSRPPLHQHTKTGKQNNSKEERSIAELQAPVLQKRDCPTGVIIANPNRRSPDRAFGLAQVSASSSKALENRIVTSKSSVSISVANCVSHSVPAQQIASSISHTNMSNTGDHKAITSANCNTQVTTHSFSTSPPSPIAVVSSCNSRKQSSILKVSPSKPCAKSTISSSPHRAILPKYNNEPPSSISTNATCPTTNAASHPPLDNESMNYSDTITAPLTCVISGRPSFSVNKFHNYPARSSTPFSYEKPNTNFSEHHAYREKASEVQHFRNTIPRDSCVGGQSDLATSQERKMSAPNVQNPVCQKEMYKCRQMSPAESPTNKAIPCKVIVDNSSASYQSAPNMPGAPQNPPTKGVKTETVLRLQESIMSRAESFRQRTEQNGTFNLASRVNNKMAHVAYGVLHNLPTSQHGARREGDPPERGAANLIYSSLLYRHAEKVTVSEQEFAWVKAKETDMMVIHRNQRAGNLRQNSQESTNGLRASQEPCNFSKCDVIKSEPSDMDIGDFKEPMNRQPSHHRQDVRPARAYFSTVPSLAENNPVLEDHKGTPQAIGSSCRQSLVEANNPLVTQLLQGSLPLEKALPQTRSGVQLEINRLPLSFQNSKTVLFDKAAVDNTRGGISPDGKGRTPGLGRLDTLRQLDTFPNKRPANALGGAAHIKSEQGVMTMDSETKKSCVFSTHSRQLEMGKPFAQDWESQTLTHGRIDPSMELMQSRKPLSACSFQKRLPTVDKKGSFPSEGSASQRLFYSPLTVDSEPGPPACRKSTLNKLVFHRNQEQNGQDSVAIDQLRKASGFPYALQMRQIDDTESVSQPAQNKLLLLPPNGPPEVLPDLKQTAAAIETIRGLNWPTTANICSKIKVEPLSFDEKVGNSCEISAKQAPYEQNDCKENMQSFHTKSPEFPLFLAPEQQKILVQKTPHLQPNQQPYGNYSSAHFANRKFARTASVIEKSMGTFLSDSTAGQRNLSTHGTPLSGQKFADLSGAEKLELKCSCRLKAMIVCKGCGAFCHHDCIGPSELCVACLVVR